MLTLSSARLFGYALPLSHSIFLSRLIYIHLLMIMHHFNASQGEVQTQSIQNKTQVSEYTVTIVQWDKEDKKGMQDLT